MVSLDNPSRLESDKVSNDVLAWEVENAEARQATQLEHALTLRDCFRLYRKAIAFSLLFSTAIIMEGYDLSLLGSFYGYDA
jgi:SP family general alpha glucoside:H+ symporter-like MFS transporter